MTAVKEQFMRMLPQSLSDVPDDEVQYMINILVKWSKQEALEKPVKTYKKRDYVPNPKYTEENRAERMRRFRKSAGAIDVDEDAICKMRERSMI